MNRPVHPQVFPHREGLEFEGQGVAIGEVEDMPRGAPRDDRLRRAEPRILLHSGHQTQDTILGDLGMIQIRDDPTGTHDQHPPAEADYFG